MKINKKILIILSIVVLAVLYFTLGTSNEKISLKQPDRILPVKILVMDKNKTDESITLAKANDGDIDQILYFTMGEAYLYKNGDTYEADLNNFNDIIFENITDYAFAKNNDLGQTISDAKFIKKAKKVIIPASYFEDKNNASPIQFEIQNRLTEKQLKNTKVKVTVSSFGKKTKTVVLDNFDMQTDISIAGYNSGSSISKSDIGVYLNDKKIKMSSDNYDWNSKTGVVSLKALPITLNDIYVTVNKKNIFSRFLNIKIANAVSYSKMRVYQTIEGTPDADTIKDGYSTSANLTIDNLFDTTTSGKGSCDFSSGYTITAHWTKKEACLNGWHYTYGYGGSYASSYWANSSNKHSLYYYASENPNHFSESATATKTVYTTFLVDLTNYSIGGTTLRSADKQSGGTNDGQGYPTWISLICYDIAYAPSYNTSANQPTLASGNNIEIKVLKRTSKYMVLGFKTKTIGGQNGFGIYKFGFSDDEQCTDLTIGKTFEGDPNANKAGVKIQLFDEEFACKYDITGFGAKLHESFIDEVTTDSLGWATFYNLGVDNETTNTFYYRESPTNSFTDYYPDTTCHSITAPTTRHNCHGLVGSLVSGADATIINKKKKYCLTVTKKENGTNTTLNSNSFTFTLTGANGSVYGPYSTTNGSVTFSDLPKQAYTLKETNNHGVIVNNKKYWNNNSGGISIAVSDLTEMKANRDGTTSLADTTCNTKSVSDTPYYYCLRVKKIDSVTGEVPKDADGNVLTADFTVNGQTKTTDSNGIATFLLGNIAPTNSNPLSYTIKETRAPDGYTAAPDKTVTINGDNESSYIIAQGNANTEANCNAPVTNTTFSDTPYVLNWYKVTENGSTRLPGAKFKVNDGAIKTKGMGTGIYSGCYQYSSSGTNSEFTADANGAVCIIGLPNGTYKVTETKPGEYHTFGDVTEKNIASSASITAINDSNKFINKPTYVKFHKTVSNTNLAGDGENNEFKDITTAELKKIDFNVYDSSNNLLSFVYNNSEGVYEYAKDNTLDLPGVSSATTDLHLNDDRNIIIKHLAKGTYRIVEKETKICGNTSSTNENCIGYYTPNNASTFTITDNSTKNGDVYKTIVEMNNTPTEIEFTKKDFYGYEDASDIVDFENDKERNDFDKIVFKIKDENGNYLNLRYMGKEGTCLTDDSYSIYRYVPSDNTNVSNNPNTGTELHTCGGHIRITNLCKGKRYIIEEISVPDDSVFVLQKDENGKNPEASYTVPCKEGEVTRESTTSVINDKPTRIRIEKRDLKYGNLIKDENVTFEIYRCPKDQTCNPSEYDTVSDRANAGMKLIKFAPRAYLTNDEEDGGADDFETSYQVYKAMSDSDAQNGTNYETSLHPDKGVLILRYLQSGYNYVALETKGAVGYNLPSGKLAETNFTVINTTVDVEAIKVANRPSKIIVRKYDSNGKLLTGARFKIYKVNKNDYNENIAISLQKKTELSLKTIRAGVYEYRETYDTNEFTTCSDTEISKCSSITESLTDDSFVTSDLKETLDINEGEAIIQYLEVDNYYIIEEVKAPEGHELAKGEDRFKIVYLPESVEKVDVFTELVNTETTFTFYKFDEYNNLLDGAEFKLQKLNQNKKYVDVTVTEMDVEDKKVYKIDSSSDNTVITTTNGSATVAYMTKGQYRIVETKAAPGKELPKKTLNVATFFVDDNGEVYGNAIITNKSKTKMIESKPTASAELIVNIQTGQTVIRYTLIIIVLLLIGVGLFIVKKKMDKK